MLRQTPTGKTVLTEEQEAYLKANYLTMPVKAMCKVLQVSNCCLTGRMRKLGLVVPPEIIAKRKLANQFKPGLVPVNKGKKQTEYMSAEAIERTKSTRFKKGIVPHNSYNEPGKIVTRTDHKDRSGRKYKWLCLKLGVWVLYHKHLWEQKNGKVPAGHCLWFKDGDSMNCNLENLELITRKENRFRNASHQTLTPKYLARCIVGKNGDTTGVQSHKELINLKRNQLLLQRAIKQEKSA